MGLSSGLWTRLTTDSQEQHCELIEARVHVGPSIASNGVITVMVRESSSNNPTESKQVGAIIDMTGCQ